MQQLIFYAYVGSVVVALRYFTVCDVHNDSTWPVRNVGIQWREVTIGHSHCYLEEKRVTTPHEHQYTMNGINVTVILGFINHLANAEYDTAPYITFKMNLIQPSVDQILL